jgi:hypothetical protein
MPEAVIVDAIRTRKSHLSAVRARQAERARLRNTHVGDAAGPFITRSG